MMINKLLRIRLDGRGKVIGELKYMIDFSFSGMLYGKVLRSVFFYVEIVLICIMKVEEMVGVWVVVIYKDVFGVN